MATIRVLQCVNNMHRAGLETMLMNYYRNIDRSKIQFDFLTHRPERSDYDDEIEQLGGRVYYAPRLYPQNYAAYFSYMKTFFHEHPEYKIVHSHIDSMSFFPLLAAKRAGVPIRISHSHSTSIDKDFKYVLKQFFRSQLLKVANYRFSCGEDAGRFLFRGKPFEIIPNAIDADAFSYDPNMRASVRRELNIEGKFVIGHVGRFNYPKNHSFLIRLFSRVAKSEENACLLLIGTGENEQMIKDLVSKEGLEKKVLLLGNRNDVQRLYQAMDVFVLPSLFEGIPMVGVEAQFSGLPCLFSENVSREVLFTEDCRFLKLDMDCWEKAILALRDRERTSTKTDNGQYDIKAARIILEEKYTELYREALNERTKKNN